MKRWIRSSTETNILFEDKITLNLDLVVDEKGHLEITSATQNFPGVEQFRKDIVEMLENEYKFEVIEDEYDGKKQKGYSSNRKDSISLYFDTYFDFANAHEVVKKAIPGLADQVPEKGVIRCFIHLRISDHTLNDAGDVSHNEFLRENAKKYAFADPNVTHIIREEEFEVKEQELYLTYDEALDDLRADIEGRFLTWIKKIDRLEKNNRI